MRFALETDKTPKQCVKAIQERFEQNPTKTRPELKGFADKDSGRFSMSMETTVFGRFKRRTRLRGQAVKRGGGVTSISGFVPHGMDRTQLRIIAAFVVVLVLFMYLRGQLIYGIMILLAGGALAIPLWGDHLNHDHLLYELEKATGAKPPKN